MDDKSTTHQTGKGKPPMYRDADRSETYHPPTRTTHAPVDVSRSEVESHHADIGPLYEKVRAYVETTVDPKALKHRRDVARLNEKMRNK